MPADNSSVKTTQDSPATEPSAADVDKEVLQELGYDQPGVKQTEDTETPGSDPTDETDPPETEPPAKDGTQDGGEAESDEKAEPNQEQETEPDTENEPDEKMPPDATPRAQERIRQLASEKAELKKALEAKEAKLLAMQAAPSNGTAKPNAAAPPPPPPQQAEPSARELRNFIRDLQAAKENGQPLNGQEVTQADIDWANDQLHRQTIRETLREDRQREQAAAQAADQRRQVIKRCIALEKRDSRFALLNDEGKLADTPFARAVAVAAKEQGVRDDSSLMVVAYEVADRVRTGELELAQAQTKQAEIKTRKVIKATSLSSPARAKAGTGATRPASDLQRRADAGDSHAQTILAQQEMADWLKS